MVAIALRIVMSRGAILFVINTNIDILVTCNGPSTEDSLCFTVLCRISTLFPQLHCIYFEFKHFTFNFITIKYTVTQN